MSLGGLFLSGESRIRVGSFFLENMNHYLMKREVKSVGNMQRLVTKEKPISVITTILN